MQIATLQKWYMHIYNILSNIVYICELSVILGQQGDNIKNKNKRK